MADGAMVAKPSGAEASARRLSGLAMFSLRRGKSKAATTPRARSAGTQLPQSARTHRSLDTADEVLIMVLQRLEAGKHRTIDLFRHIDASGDGLASAEELYSSLAEMGATMSGKEFALLLEIVDRDRSGEVTLKELDRALKSARRAQTAPLQGQGPFNRTKGEFESSFTWASRSMRMADRQAAEASHRSWVPHSQGPAAAAKNIPIGRGNVVDNSILRERLHDRAGVPGAVPPSLALGFHSLPTYRTVYKTPIFAGRFGKVPTSALADSLAGSRETCKSAQRELDQGFLEHGGGVKTFEWPTMLGSTVDKVLRNEAKKPEDSHPTMDRLFLGCYGQSTRQARVDGLFMDDA
mmetsp:Transcript_25422/g.59159  ORF Transcript_25422/g.59159 Transcript_25422/m.59159 type:complete len:351 (-) Transcript_25422:325-1377(-)|eukprot:CAMPEP_0178409352 /NCGR_PEP_ID=MMETSP0689_2-20121128/20418_1 /TAXON_ID=160604 /ORGANISM="Amphidinium massartii, Strain CS-259" /LENGTH=350 /DNA_ID=CAMNT_0020030491 /DNA_START=43 /DNA_END=1098 /DNA_ORIENTATION=+